MEQQFQDFIMSVPSKEQTTVLEIDKLLKANNCTCEIKEAKQGYLVSYIKMIQGKRTTILNFVFRKTGIKARIYANNILQYQSWLNELPNIMKKEIIKSGDCKRLYNPDSCNSKCTMGYKFVMDDNEYRKCKNMAFMPTLCKENDDYILEFVRQELIEISKKCN